MNDHADSAPLDRDSPLPLFFQLRERLLGLVARWEDRDKRFPTDEEIADLYGVSRTTVRQAISTLVREHLLHRIPGNGTYVTAPRLEEHLEPGMNIRRQWSANFSPVEVQVLHFERLPAGSNEADLLGLSDGAEVLHVRRIRKAGGVPVAIDERYIPGEFVTEWTEENVRGSMLHQLWERSPLQVGDLTLQAALASADECALLQLRPGTPVMVRTLAYEDVGGRRIMAGRSVHRADLMRYRVRIPLQRHSDPMGGTPESISVERTPVMQED
jgi:GntR family transcriptional regulator